MAKLRLLFTKEAQASYISHLDTMRTFQRVFPRAELHLKHSNGFHPHPIISIVLPLPVGQSSDCELLDFETVEETDGAGIAEKLNTGLPAGLRVRECYPVTRPVREFTFLRARLERRAPGLRGRLWNRQVKRQRWLRILRCLPSWCLPCPSGRKGAVPR